MLLASLAAVQFYWFREAYHLEDRDFDQRVTSALRVVCSRLINFNNRPNRPPLRPVERVTANYYTVQINDRIDPSALEAFLKQEFARQDIKTNFEYGIYDCEQSQIRYGGFVCHSLNCDTTQVLKYAFPQVKSQNYYFGVFFPEKRSYLLNQLNLWAISTAAVLVLIVFFGYALWVIFKQKRLSEIQTDFVNNLTHEFKTPLSTILISTEVLKKPNQSAERLANYAGIIQKETLRLKQQVDTVLQTARPRYQTLELVPVDIHEIIREVASHFRDQVIELDLTATPFVLQADPVHLSNVLYNLIDNAIKYTNQTPLIRIHTFTENKRFVIWVTDQGIGIAKDQLTRIFDKFYRVPTGNIHNVKGFGLGLYYVKNVTEQMKGQVKVISIPGQGSTFELRFPTA
ncbi:MAG: HAMP domain-containing sensor histidine kinase [Siphonobacter sp.]